MADPVMSDLPLRRVLESVSEDYQTAAEIEKLHARMYPPELEGFLKISDALRRKIFHEKKGPTVEEQLDTLVRLGYVEQYTTDYYLKPLPQEITYYRKSPTGRRAVFSARGKRRS